MIDEQIGTEGSLQFLEKTVGHRCAGETELAHRADIARFKQRMVNEIVIQGRHQIEIGHAFGGNQSQRFGGIEPAQANKCAPDERHGKQAAHAHRVIERHDAKCPFAGAVEVLRNMGKRRGPFGVLAAGHALGPRRGAGRIEHHRASLGARARRGIGRGQRRERREAFIFLRPVIDRDPRQLPRQRRSGQRGGGNIFVGDGFGVRIVQKKIELARRRAPINRCDDEAGKLTCPMQACRLPAVLQRGDKMIVRLEPQRLEAGDERRDAPVPLRIGQAHLTVGDGEHIGVARNAAEKAQAQVEHAKKPVWRRFCSRHDRLLPHADKQWAVGFKLGRDSSPHVMTSLFPNAYESGP
jgi:hypothetical protein